MAANEAMGKFVAQLNGKLADFCNPTVPGCFAFDSQVHEDTNKGVAVLTITRVRTEPIVTKSQNGSGPKAEKKRMGF